MPPPSRTPYSGAFRKFTSLPLLLASLTSLGLPSTDTPDADSRNGYAFRYGKWKYVVGGISCDAAHATFNCSAPQLYDMDVDWAETTDLAAAQPAVLTQIAANFSRWHASVLFSRANESQCAPPPPGPPTPFPPHPAPSQNCTLTRHAALNGDDMALGSVASVDECCGACHATPGCAAADYRAATAMHPTFAGSATGGTCHLKRTFSPKPEVPGYNQTAMRLGA